MLDQFSQLSRRLRDKRRRGVLTALAAALFALIAVSAAGGGEGGAGGPAVGGHGLARSVSAGAAEARPKKHCLGGRDLREAKRFAATRDGSVGFAFLDECGRLVGLHRNRVFPSASVVKVMLLAAYLRRDGAAHSELSGEERDLLTAMITMSDNDAADRIFAGVGEAGLDDVAAAAGMRNFVSSPFWGGSGVSAADQAAFVGRLAHFVPKRHEDFALRLLRNVIPGQRWGVADVEPKGWKLGFKGGWYMAPDGWRVNQVATLDRGRRSFALAVLSDENPSFQYGRETIAGVAKRLMEDYRR